jgi:hypothetical protein
VIVKRTPQMRPAALLVLALALSACGGGDEEGATTKAEAQPPPPATTQPKAQTLTEQVTALVLDELGDDAPGDRSRIRRVKCVQRVCSVHYNANEAILDAAKETIDDQRWIWQHMFADLNVREATLVPWAETTSVGGKKSDDPIMRVTCDRQANAQIDWENVTDDGVKELCTYVPLVNFG